MKKVLQLAAILILSLRLSAQMPGNGTGQKIPAIGHIYGKLVDSTGKSVGNASVVLLQTHFDTTTKKRKDVLLKGVAAKSNGEFSLEELPIFGPLKLKITASGYKPFEQMVFFQPGGNTGKPAAGQTPDFSAMSAGFDKDLGNIKLTTDVKQLLDVTVTTTRSALRMDIDKKVFNVDKNIVSSGGTALDVMKNVPSVQVDIDGNVKLRNSAPQLYIDGRPTTLSLDQIPADAIESVEVITNPSAKYDASGGNAGILNIVLKKNRKTGYNGNLMAGIDKRGGTNAGGSFSVRQGKFNVTANAMRNQNKGRTTGTTDLTKLGNYPDVYTHQSNYTRTNGAFVFGSLGVDYFATNRTTFSLTGIKVHGKFSPGDVINAATDSLFNTGTTTSFATRNSSTTREFNANGLQLGMKHLFPKSGEELTADLNYFSGKSKGNALYITDSMNAADVKYATDYQKVINSGDNHFLTIQTDYTNPLTANTKLETGLRAQLRKTASSTDTYIQDNAGLYNKIPNAASNYTNKDNVYAAYVSLTSGIKNFGYKLGLRAESSNYNGELLNTGDQFKNKYPVSLFPSLFLSQKLNNKQEVQFSYTRRINRPNFFNQIPYTDRTDKLYVIRGNPNLVPEFTSSFEASYSKTFAKNNTFLASLYYKRTNDLITQYLTSEVDPVTGGYILTYINANSSYSYGTELTSVNYLTKWWDVTSNINIYDSKINTDSVKTSSQPALLSWFGKINNNFKLPKNFTIQISGNYQSKTNLPVNNNQQQFGPPAQAQSASQGYIKPFYSVDGAIRKTFLKNNAAAVTLSVSDIFRSRKSFQHSESTYFVQDYYRLRDPQMIKLNLTFRFGQMDMSLFKRKNMKNAGEGMQATQM